MMPPYCAICGKKNANHLVYFKLTPEEEAEERLKNYPHHPRNAVWLCDEHFNIIKDLDYKNMRAEEAIEYILSKIKKDGKKDKED